MAAKFQQIKKHILTKIESGEWQENDPVPSENKLAEDFSVSRMTARRALEELNQQGLLIRTKGSGTFVASLKNQGSMFEIRDIADEIKERGHTHQAIQIQLEQVIASTSIAIALDVAIDSPIAHSIIVHQQLPNQEPCLQLTRKTSSKNGVVCFAQIIYPGSSYRLSGHLTFKNT